MFKLGAVVGSCICNELLPFTTLLLIQNVKLKVTNESRSQI